MPHIVSGEAVNEAVTRADHCSVQQRKLGTDLAHVVEAHCAQLGQRRLLIDCPLSSRDTDPAQAYLSGASDDS
jgi:hypothetical protein